MTRASSHTLKLCALAWLACGGPAVADPIDCAAIKNSILPYELLIWSEGGSISRIKVYRGEKLMRHIVIVKGDQTFRSDLQGNFQLRSDGGNGTTVQWTLQRSH